MKPSKLSKFVMAALVAGLLPDCASRGGVPDCSNCASASVFNPNNSCAAPALSLKQIYHLVKTRAGDDRIIRQILDSHAVYDLDAGTILQMEDTGFSKTLIACLIDTGANLVVDQAPPRPLGESPVAAPGPDFMWIPGEWHIQGGTWTWVGGGWILTPDANAVWVPTRWDYGANGWHRIPGRWQ